jgi:hypothetical protein
MTILSPVARLSNPTTPRYRRSFLRQIFDAAMQARQRQATAELAKYLRNHQHSLNPQVRAELERHLIDG